MNRKIAVILALVILPGGFIALALGLLGQLLQRTVRGQRALQYARARAPSWLQAPLPGLPRAA